MAVKNSCLIIPKRYWIESCTEQVLIINEGQLENLELCAGYINTFRNAHCNGKILLNFQNHQSEKKISLIKLTL